MTSCTPTGDVPDELAAARVAAAARALRAAALRAEAHARAAEAGPRVAAIAAQRPDIAAGILATDAALAAIADGTA